MSNLLLRPINVNTLLIIIAIVAVLAIIFAVLIVSVSKLCAVKEDERAKQIEENLAGANCGGCGYAGCADFAKALLEGKATIDGCGPTSNEGKKQICSVLGVEFVEKEDCFAVVHCAGGKVSLDKYAYTGNQNCILESMQMGGKKTCSEGCIGEGTCASLCPYYAISVKQGVAVADRSLCEACGVCVKKCPKHLIELVPKSSLVYVACSSKCKGKDVMNTCKVGCIGCGICAKFCPENAITMQNNIPVIDYSKCTGCKTCVSKCPRKCIREI